MAIYDIFELDKREIAHKAECKSISLESSPEPEADPAHESASVPVQAEPHPRDRFFSSLTARLFFLILLLADLLWVVYTVVLFVVFALLSLMSLCKVPTLLKVSGRRWLSVKRSLICAVSLFISLFSPSFGIMIACTYFLMYDKSGIEEVIPSSLQSQFKEFFKG